MIHVSAGHEKGVGLEVFLKSFVLLNDFEKTQFLLHISPDSLKKYLNDYNIIHQISDSTLHFWGNQIKIAPLKQDVNQSIDSILSCLDNIKQNDILITLPTSKDQLFYQDVYYTGHTDFFRHYFNNQNICMTFISPTEDQLLITDHIPLREVSCTINDELIINKVGLVLNNCHYDIVLIAGINPHAGEEGLLGQEDQCIKKAIFKLKTLFPHTSFTGPLPGDTLDFHKSQNLKQLFVYMYHDQGLSKFKALNKTIGINQTIGLPFVRLSVDHGTAFDLYAKNKANYMGAHFLLKYALKKL